MDGSGPETTKRPRLDSYAGGLSSHRIHHTQQPPPEVSHNHSNHALPPPTAYHQHLPPSPYHPSHDTVNEHRCLPEPTQHGYPHAHSGYTTPIRDVRSYPSESTYSRHGSASAPTRSPDDIQQLNQLRPLNTAPANEGQNFPQHSYSEAARPQSGYVSVDGHPNGNGQGLSMSNHNESAPALAHPEAPGGFPTSPTSNGASLHSGGGGPLSGPQISPWIQRPTRKNTRATQACDTCRTRKAKCDEGKPSCGYCQEFNLTCNYKEVPPAKGDRAHKEMMDRLRDIESKGDRTAERLERTEAKLDKLQTLLETYLNRLPLPFNSDIKPIPRREVSDTPDKKPEVFRDESIHQSTVEPNGQTSDRAVGIYHTNAAHRLLRWPSIKMLLKRRPVNEDYVMQFEERKGLLRVYGTGQGKNPYDEYPAGPTRHLGPPSQMAPSRSTTSSPSAGSDDIGRNQMQSSPSLWGTGGFAPPNPPDAKPWEWDHPGGLDLDGTLKMDPQTMSRLYESYLNNIHIMHPFLDKTRMRSMFDRLAHRKFSSASSARASSSYVPQSSTSETFREGSLGFNPANKRKYSSGVNMGSQSDTSMAVYQPLERHISTAIVLLVMALGKICEHKDVLQGPMPDNPKETAVSAPRSFSPLTNQDSPPTSSIKQSPASSSVSAYASTRSPMSEVRGTSWTRGPSEDQNSPFTGRKYERNVDFIPGLAYYAYATDILGNQHGGVDLPHVQANLLASLYMGQLACAFESWSWIRTACSVCHHIVRDPTLKKEGDAARKDAIRFAYYSCVQLESDMLAELDLRQSGIDRAEFDDIVAYPKGVTENISDFGVSNEPGNQILHYYSAQIYLRTMLNKVQKTLYPPGATHSRISLSTRDECQQMLTSWRDLLPLPMQWTDTDPPSKDVNEARLRAKYYGALYIIHRPFLHYALHSSEFRNGPYPESGQITSTRADQEPGNMPPPGFTSHDKDEIYRSAQTCVQAAIWSTLAFDGICLERRLILTNIFGTAQAQFGNCLVLAATFRSHLYHLIDQHTIISLLDRTISFLRRHRSISQTLEEGAKILESVLQVVRNPDQSSSFSSVSS